MKIKIIFISVIVFSLAYATLAVAEKAEPRFPPQVMSMVLDAKKSVKTIDMNTFRTILSETDKVIIVDVI